MATATVLPGAGQALHLNFASENNHGRHSRPYGNAALYAFISSTACIPSSTWLHIQTSPTGGLLTTRSQ